MPFIKTTTEFDFQGKNYKASGYVFIARDPGRRCEGISNLFVHLLDDNKDLSTADTFEWYTDSVSRAGGDALEEAARQACLDAERTDPDLLWLLA